MLKPSELIETLRGEIEASTGCTDPGSISLAVAEAANILGARPERIDVTLSPNLYKNAVSVGIPGTYQSGLELAAALGALIKEPDKGLATLSEVNDELVAVAKQEVAKGYIHIAYGEAPDPLYVRAVAYSGGDEAEAVIAGDYSNVVKRVRNGEVLYSAEETQCEEEKYPFLQYSVEELYNLILSMDPSDFDFLVECAERNMAAAKADMQSHDARLAKILRDRMPKKHGDIFDVINYAQTNTAAAGEARMSGMNVTIMAIAGSGNHGITNFVGVFSVAEVLGCTRERTAAALAISSMITIYIKGYVKRMTAFCGCGVAAATGVAAASVYLLGGTFRQAVDAMQSVVGSIGGMFCDGAKMSCAYKLSTAVSTAIQCAALAVEGCGIPSRAGIIGPTIEKTFENMGRLNNPGMVQTDKELIAIIRENQTTR